MALDQHRSIQPASRERDRPGLTRRDLARFIFAGVLVVPLAIRAQSATGIRRIGVLSPGPTLAPEQYQGVWEPLRKLGWVEGQNLVFERRWADGNPERLRPLAEELVRSRVELIVTIGSEATAAAKAATTAIPIVMLSSADPVASGLVGSLARPGGNVTGLSMVAPDLDAKRLALLHEAVPNARRIGVLVDPTTAIAGFSREETQRSFELLGLELILVQVSSSGKLNEAVAEVSRRGAQALVVHDDVLSRLNTVSVMRAALQHKLPAVIHGGRKALEAGGLLSYDIDDDQQVARMSTYVDKILRGARASDLPVEQPTTFKLVISLATAKALGITIPQSLLLRADEVIQ